MDTRDAFHIYLIKPTRYDDDGYPIHWGYSWMPANSLACLYGIADECRERQVLGSNVDIKLHALDETTIRTDHKSIIQAVRRDNAKVLIALVGVQSNQFPRALAVAQPFLDEGYSVCMGGFHVSGCYSMLADVPPEILEAQEMGISMFLGEAEEQRFDEVIQDAYSGALKPVYDYTNKLPDLANAPIPHLPKEIVKAGTYSSFDVGRGCPYECSFCCIINVQGRKSRFRSVDALEEVIRKNDAIDVHAYFITDDNFARNKNWEAILDHLAWLREEEGLQFRLIIQVDTLCHKIPNFIEKCVRAGVDQVFFGLENINPDNLIASKKRQNKITDYRDMLLAWKKFPVVLYGGYIIGFPNDTRESILNDIAVIKRELPMDVLNLSILTPLPGSEDHKNALEAGVWMDPDLNKYNLTSRVTHHPLMSDEEFDKVYLEAGDLFYSNGHAKTVMKRSAALGSDRKYITAMRIFQFGVMTKVNNDYALDTGFWRKKFREDRRPGLALENPFVFYPKYLTKATWTASKLTLLMLYYKWLARRIFNNPKKFEYTDEAIQTPEDDDLDRMGLYQQTRGGVEAVEKFRRQTKIKAKARAAGTA